MHRTVKRINTVNRVEKSKSCPAPQYIEMCQPLSLSHGRQRIATGAIEDVTGAHGGEGGRISIFSFLKIPVGNAKIRQKSVEARLLMQMLGCHEGKRRRRTAMSSQSKRERESEYIYEPQQNRLFVLLLTYLTRSRLFGPWACAELNVGKGGRQKAEQSLSRQP